MNILLDATNTDDFPFSLFIKSKISIELLQTKMVTCSINLIVRLIWRRMLFVWKHVMDPPFIVYIIKSYVKEHNYFWFVQIDEKILYEKFHFQVGFDVKIHAGIMTVVYDIFSTLISKNITIGYHHVSVKTADVEHSSSRWGLTLIAANGGVSEISVPNL